MSDITTVYDAFVSRVSTVLPDHLRLSDPYLMQKNAVRSLRKAYGFRIGPGSNTGQSLSCDLVLSRDIILVLTRLVTGRETDIDKKADVEKTLMEDLFLIISDVESNPSLNSSAVLATDYVSDGGVEFVKGERDDFLMSISTFRIRYRENLN